MIRVNAHPTPDGELRRQILSKCVEKSEREWWAARTIEKLEFELNAANDRIQRLEEAGDRMTTWLRHDAREGSKELSALRQWRKAKEAKQQ